MPPKENKNVVERSKPTGVRTISLGIGGHWTTYKDPSSYPSNTTSKGGEGGKGGQWGYSGSNNGQTKINPQVAKQITDKISTSESAIQNEIGRLKGLNPIASEETLRSAAIQELGIATFEELLELESYQNIVSTRPSDSFQEKALAVNVAQKITPYVLSLTSGEWSLGIHTASSEGRKSKDSTYGLSNQVMICLEHLKIHGGADKLKVLTFTECDLTTNDMIYFGNTMLQYPLLLKYLDFSYNRIGDIGTISFINSFVTSPTGKYPMHHIINLNLSNNGIGDDGATHIAAYLKHGYMPATTHVNLADNIITDKGAQCFAESLYSSVNKLKVTHLEGNKITKTGESYLVKALLDKSVQHMVIFTQKLEQNSKLFPFVGTKEEKTVIYKEYLKKGIEKGTNDKCIVVDKTLLGELKNTGNQILSSIYGVGGFIKCNWKTEEVIESYAQDTLTAKISKTLTKIWGKITNIEGVVSCYLEATDEMYTSQAGQKALAHEVYVAGESDICSE